MQHEHEYMNADTYTLFVSLSSLLSSLFSSLPCLSLHQQGNGAMGGCCSKCYRDMMKKEECKLVAAAAAEKPKESSMQDTVQPMDVEPAVETPAPAAVPAVLEQEPLPDVAAASATCNSTSSSSTSPKKKKKKASYKDMMQGMIKTTTDADAKEKQKEQLRKVTGGGEFSKIDKI
jgi:hypothetical protein